MHGFGSNRFSYRPDCHCGGVVCRRCGQRRFILPRSHLYVRSGDVKLLSVAGLWAGPHLIAVLVIVTAIAAGFVSILMAILAHRRAPSIEEESVTLVKPPIPYGVAIAIGGLATLAMIAQPILLPG